MRGPRAGLLVAVGLAGVASAAAQIPAPLGVVPVYSVDPRDSWNTIHHFLFTYPFRARIPAETAEVPAPALPEHVSEDERERILGAYYEARYLGTWSELQRTEGGDAPDFFHSAPPRFLLRTPRFQQVASALEAELKVPPPGPERSTLARVRFQQDLWSSFDGLLALDVPDRRVRVRRERLLALLGRLIARTAPPAEALRAVPSSLGDVARVHGEVEGGLLGPASPWRELVPAPGEETVTSAHAQTVDHRRVYRAFVRYPEWAGGAGCLEARLGGGTALVPGCPEGVALPTGAAALLVESPLVVDDAGGLVALPLALTVQARRVRALEPGADGRYGLEDLAADVFQAPWKSLVNGKPELLPLAAADLVPQGLGAVPRADGAALVPLRLSCVRCHGLEGRVVMPVPSEQAGPLRVLASENDVAAVAVLAAKRESASFRALQRYFADGR